MGWRSRWVGLLYEVVLFDVFQKIIESWFSLSFGKFVLSIARVVDWKIS